MSKPRFPGFVLRRELTILLVGVMGSAWILVLDFSGAQSVESGVGVGLVVLPPGQQGSTQSSPEGRNRPTRRSAGEATSAPKGTVISAPGISIPQPQPSSPSKTVEFLKERLAPKSPLVNVKPSKIAPPPSIPSRKGSLSTSPLGKLPGARLQRTPPNGIRITTPRLQRVSRLSLLQYNQKSIEGSSKKADPLETLPTAERRDGIGDERSHIVPENSPPIRWASSGTAQWVLASDGTRIESPVCAGPFFRCLFSVMSQDLSRFVSSILSSSTLPDRSTLTAASPSEPVLWLLSLVWLAILGRLFFVFVIQKAFHGALHNVQS